MCCLWRVVVYCSLFDARCLQCVVWLRCVGRRCSLLVGCCVCCSLLVACCCLVACSCLLFLLLCAVRRSLSSAVGWCSTCDFVRCVVVAVCCRVASCAVCCLMFAACCLIYKMLFDGR